MSDTAQLLWYILIIGVIGVGALLVGVLAARFVKKRLQTTTPAEAFTIQDLREMHQRGEITTPEYEAMRAAIIARATAPAPRGPGQPEPDGHDPQGPQSDTASDLPVTEDPPPTEDPKDH